MPRAKTAKAAGTAGTTLVEIPQLEVRQLEITIVGDSPLICHRWSQKARDMMLAKQMKKAKQAAAAKDPEQDYLESLYPHPDGGYGFPSVAFKSAAVDAASLVAGITKVEARGAFHIIGDLVSIEGTPRMREDMVRVGMGVADIRHRGEFPTWRATFRLRYNPRVLSAEQLASLFDSAGFGIGVGEWRPQRDGSFGMFHVARQTELEA
jgi:hypothetical protein